jgi:hypothetical protein
MNLSIENNCFMVVDDTATPKLLFTVDPNEYICEKSPQQLVDGFIDIIKKYDMVMKYTYSRIPVANIITIISNIFQKLIKEKSKGVKALEIGSGYGAISVFAAMTLKLFSEDNMLFAMDTWDGTSNESIAKYENIYEHYRKIIRWAGVDKNISRIVCNTAMGLDALRSNYYDIIITNTSDSYNNTKDELLSEIRVAKTGGMLIGGNCECKAKDLPPETDTDHVDIIKALHDVFKDDYELDETTWIKKITNVDKNTIEKEKNKVIALCDDICDRIEKIKTGCKLSDCGKQVFEIAQKLDSLIVYLDNVPCNYTNHPIKVLSITLQNDLVFVCSGIETGNIETSEKYINLVSQLYIEWKTAIHNEFSNF